MHPVILLAKHITTTAPHAVVRSAMYSGDLSQDDSMLDAEMSVILLPCDKHWINAFHSQKKGKPRS